MGTYNFIRDLKNSKTSVEEAKEMIEASLLFGDKPCKVKEVHTKECDLILEHPVFQEEYLVEIKEDISCSKYGNVAVEYECRGKPSGLITTKAPYWVYKVHTKSGIKWLFTIPEVIKSAALDKSRHLRYASGGDQGSNTKLVLFTLEQFLDISMELKPYVTKEMESKEND